MIGDETIVPALMFTGEMAGKSEEAMNFYGGIFENSEIVSISRYLPGEQHAQFTLNGKYFVSLDSSGPHDEIKFTEGVSFVVECETQDEIDHLWEKLTDGGSESRCGWLKDKFGVSWQIVPSVFADLMSDPERSKRVIAAFMEIKKFNIQ